MKTVVLVIMILVCFNFCLKQTFLKPWSVALTSVLCALFVGLAWPYAIEQSRSQIDAWLANQSLMLDTSVVICLEVLWQMSFCFVASRLMYAGKLGRKMLWFYRLLRFFPGILVLAVLFAVEVSLIYNFVGADFSFVAWGFAVVVLGVFPAVALFVKYFIPEKVLRLETLFLCNVLLLILGIVATVNGTTNFKGSDEIEWGAFVAFVLLSLVCGAAGYVVYKKRVKTKI